MGCQQDFNSSPPPVLLQNPHLFDLHQKPAVNFRQVENLLDGGAGAQGVAVGRVHLAGFALRLRVAR